MDKLDKPITIVTVHNPFDRRDREIRTLPAAPGQTAAQCLQMVAADDPAAFDVSVNGRLIIDHELEATAIRPGDYVVLVPRIAGDGGGDKVLRTLLSIALVALTFAVGSFVAAGFTWAGFISPAAWGFGAWVAAMAVNYIGGYLLSQLLPPPQQGKAPKPSWTSLGPMVGEGIVVGETYGTVRTGGVVLAQHITSSGEKQYYNYLATGGGEVDSISSIKIGSNPIENYQEVTVETRLGTNDQTTIPGFGDTYSDTGLTYDLEIGVWRTQQGTGLNTQALEILIECPAGLYKANGDGSLDTATVKISAEFRQVGAAVWSSWLVDQVISAAEASPVRRVYRIDNLSPGQYEVRVQCTYKSGTSIEYSTRTLWTMLSEIVYDDFCRPGKSLVAVKALATDQLQGSLPPVTWIQSRLNVWVWDPTANGGLGDYIQKSANNPAWACYDMLHQCRRLKNIHTGALEFFVEGPVPKDLIDYEAFAAWAAFCTERDLQFNYHYRDEMRLEEALRLPETIGRGKVVPIGTRYSCIWDGPAVPVQLFTPGNIVEGSFSQEFLSTAGRADAVEITFLDQDQDYAPRTTLVPGPGWDETTAAGNPTRVDLPGCTRAAQAYKHGRYLLHLNTLTKTYSWEADIDALACQFGDVVLVQHDAIQWRDDSAGGRIMAATATMVTLDRKVTLEPGQSYMIVVRLQDDTLVERAVEGVLEPTETDTITVMTPFDPVPQQFDIYACGRTQTVTRAVRLLRVQRSGELRVRLSGMEYVPYEEVIEVPSLPAPAPEIGITGLRVSAWRQFMGPLMLFIRWCPPRTARYAGAQVLINNQLLATVGPAVDTYLVLRRYTGTITITVRALDPQGFPWGEASVIYTPSTGESTPPPPAIGLFRWVYNSELNTLDLEYTGS